MPWRWGAVPPGNSGLSSWSWSYHCNPMGPCCTERECHCVHPVTSRSLKDFMDGKPELLHMVCNFLIPQMIPSALFIYRNPGLRSGPGCLQPQLCLHVSPSLHDFGLRSLIQVKHRWRFLTWALHWQSFLDWKYILDFDLQFYSSPQTAPALSIGQPCQVHPVIWNKISFSSPPSNHLHPMNDAT